jgi:betaine reductase
MDDDERRTSLSILKGKKIAVFGERDDVAGQAVHDCVTAAGGEVVYETTSCFV